VIRVFGKLVIIGVIIFHPASPIVSFLYFGFSLQPCDLFIFRSFKAAQLTRRGPFVLNDIDVLKNIDGEIGFPAVTESFSRDERWQAPTLLTRRNATTSSVCPQSPHALLISRQAYHGRKYAALL